MSIVNGPDSKLFMFQEGTVCYDLKCLQSSDIGERT